MVDAGWYKDPELPTQLRWWDGQAWTDHRHAMVVAPIIPPSAPAPAPQWSPPSEQSRFTNSPTQVTNSTPLVTNSGASTTQTPAPAYVPFSSLGTAEPSTPARRRGPRPLILVIGALLIAAALVIVFVIPRLDSAPGARVTAPSAAPQNVTQIGPFGPPSGMDAVQYLGPHIITAGSALATGATVFPNTQLSIPQCINLSYSAPVTSADTNSTDKMEILEVYTTGGQVPALVVSGFVRKYSSAFAARQGLAAMTATLQRCEGGYTNRHGEVHVEAVSLGLPDDSSESWIEAPASPATKTSVSTVNVIRGSAILRITCAFNNESPSTQQTCSDWMTELNQSFDLAK